MHTDEQKKYDHNSSTRPKKIGHQPTLKSAGVCGYPGPLKVDCCSPVPPQGLDPLLRDLLTVTEGNNGFRINNICTLHTDKGNVFHTNNMKHTKALDQLVWTILKREVLVDTGNSCSLTTHALVRVPKRRLLRTPDT